MTDEVQASADARLRLPREPYPGLRPFLDFEAALLFGRERQVREVIEHLKQTQFVAVLGGSGSGKSSLIHAGVVPALRSYGIPGAGDLWVPMICTPGTNVSGDDSRRRRHTPVTRLARRFAALLRTRGSPEADAARIEEIAEVFRQSAGFARLMDLYSAELQLAPGPDPADARVLFVIDQFEELFHPTNQGVPDVAVIVERVLDHFFAPHERCHVVLTMRSEHLNDCAGYLELPDAINKSSYLVRRLDADELRQAITGPAQRFLRLVVRQRGDSAQTLPNEVRFEPAVVERLLRDVQAIAHDPDHLPLLQHLLARLWEAALERERSGLPVPHEVNLADLVQAVTAGRGVPQQALADEVNTLRSSVENWPESRYLLRDAAERKRLDALMRHLAFKDPNTGLYSQQRIDVDDTASFLGAGTTRSEVRALVEKDFLGSVDYLFWDKEDPARVTLKVSHESFIRGWGRFRALIDAESDQFEEFVGVLRKAGEWLQEGRADDYLLQQAELRRLTDSGFMARLRTEELRDVWRRFLGLARDGPRLVRHEPELRAFVDASQERLAQRLRRAKAASRSAWALVGSTVLFALLPTALFAILVQGPTMRRAEQLFDAGNRANHVAFSAAHNRVGANANALDSLLRAAERVESARLGEGSWRMEGSRWLLEQGGRWPLIKDQVEFLDSVFGLTEPPVNGALRRLLTGSIWRSRPEDLADSGAVELPAPEVRRGALCFEMGAREGRGELRGLRFTVLPSPGSAGERRPLRALFVPEPASNDRALEVYSASVDPTSDLCLLGESLVSMPGSQQPKVVFDALMRVFYIAIQGPTTPVPSVLVQEIDWERGVDGRLRAFQRQRIADINASDALKAVNEATGDELAAAAPTWRMPAGRQVAVAGRHWRIVLQEASRVDLPPDAPMQALQSAAPDSVCTRLGAAATGPAAPVVFFELDQHCIQVTRSSPEAPAGTQAPPPAREELVVAVHFKPGAQWRQRSAESAPAPVATLVPFTRVAREDAAGLDKDRFFLGRGDHEGWLFLKVRNRSGQERWLGAPWSTCALWRVGHALQAGNPADEQPEAATSLACRPR